MSFRDRLLYHQIHPAKIATDASFGLLALVLLWRQRVVAGILLVTVTSLSSSVWLLIHSDLDRYRQSRAGRYMRVYQTAPVQLARFGSYGMMLAAARRRNTWVLAIGATALPTCWFYGLLLTDRNR
jgi:hypothetical protein